MNKPEGGRKISKEQKYEDILDLLRSNFDHLSYNVLDDKYGKGENQIKCEIVARLIVELYL